jgi:hypothetical protein
MTFRTLLGATALATLPIGAGLAFAEDLPACENCADAMVLMSWGGAYQASQVAAYAEPYSALTGVKITWDEGSNEANAKLRAAAEAGNMTYDLIDVEGPDSQRACDEGLAVDACVEAERLEVREGLVVAGLDELGEVEAVTGAIVEHPPGLAHDVVGGVLLFGGGSRRGPGNVLFPATHAGTLMLGLSVACPTCARAAGRCTPRPSRDRMRCAATAPPSPDRPPT